MTPIDFAIMIGGPLALITLNFGIPALADQLAGSGARGERYVAAVLQEQAR